SEDGLQCRTLLSVRYPMTSSQGLVSVLHRNSATRRYCFGFIARHITGVQRLHWAFRQDARPSPPGPNPLRERSVTLCIRCFPLAVGTALFHSSGTQLAAWACIPRAVSPCVLADVRQHWLDEQQGALARLEYSTNSCPCTAPIPPQARDRQGTDRKSTRLNSSHDQISYA